MRGPPAHACACTRAQAQSTPVRYLFLLGAGNIELEEHHVAILHHVVAALLPVLARVLAAGHTGPAPTERLEVLEGARLGFDKTALEVGVDNARGSGGQSAFVDGPRPNLRVARREVINHVQDLVAGFDDARQRALDRRALSVAVVSLASLPELSLGLLARCRQVPVLLFELNGHRDDSATSVRVHPLLNLGQPLILLPAVVPLGEVWQVDDGLGGDELIVVLDGLHLARGPLGLTDRLTLLERLHDLRVDGIERIHPLGLGRARDGLLFASLVVSQLVARGGELNVLEAELGLNRLKVTDRVDGVVDVDHGIVLEATDYMVDAIHRRDVREERVTQAGTLGGALDQARNVSHGEHGRHLARRVVEVAKVLEALVRHRALGVRRVDRTERKVLGGDCLIGEKVEKRALADVRQADEAHLQVVLHAAEARDLLRPTDLLLRGLLLRRHGV
mmetsp:Transcript_99440/g.284382  ORF Transcript_99440/g.284382 Transcript_99440/m.284382 type:complete len:449 (+) Transcript_99440:93-1439(+)